MTAQTSIHYLSDYQAPLFGIRQTRLLFDIADNHTLVTAHLAIEPHSPHTSLSLHGSAQLLRVCVNHQDHVGYELDAAAEELILYHLPNEPFILSIYTQLYPQENKSLMGLYASGGNLYTQCEPEGFRKMTYYPDRPDVMTEFYTTIIAHKARYPVLLSNGNKIDAGDLEDGKHFVVWHDPFAKPSYLFALVAGDLACTRDTFTTQSGRKVALEFFTRVEDADKVCFAMQSLKQAMSWDESRFGLEYDLDIYMVVAVGDFNMGAMENKGLNIFNTKYVLADSRTATDSDFAGVESVIAHEYFHNWTGNRVTCRDWFQLSLKEGLTVFRDQEFSTDRIGALNRIENVALLRQHQFPEDAGPMAHPVRPVSYIEMNNFYTMTVYEKGAEVVRMYHTLLGETGFQKGMKLYFERHDGQAVTCDDFRAAMADANGVDFGQFALWYSQAGTPVLNISSQLKSNGDYVLTVKQHIPATPDMQDKQAMMIPIKIALFGSEAEHSGRPVAFTLADDHTPQTEAVLCLTQTEQQFVLKGVYCPVVPSLLRGFSAPVHLNYTYSDEELSILLSVDNDPFACWEAGQTLYRRAIAANVAALLEEKPLPKHDALLTALDFVLHTDYGADFQALLLQVPLETELWAEQEVIYPLHVYQAREALLNLIATHFYERFQYLNKEAERAETARSDIAQPYEYHPYTAAWRTLRNTCRAYILRANPQYIDVVAEKYEEMAHNMTHEWGILSAINHNISEQRNHLLTQFAVKYRQDALVMDKYFSLIASSHRADTLAQIQTALKHPQFSLENPNKVRALLSTLSRNVPHFHAEDGSGYRFLAQKIMEIDRFNPQVAARLVQAFSLCQRFEPHRQQLMSEQLHIIMQQVGLSKDVAEIIGKILV